MSSLSSTCRVLFSLTLASLFLVAPQARAADNRLMLADQSDFGGKRGFYLDFENDAPGNSRPILDTLRLILGVADGTNWRFASFTPAAPAAWLYDHDYQAHAVITPTDDQLWLDGVRVASAAGPFQPLPPGPLTAFQIPDWAGAPAEYLLIEKSLTLTPESAATLTVPIIALSPGLTLFEPQAPVRVPFAADAAKTLTIDCTFRIARRPADVRSLGPFVDKYGQALAADFPTKIKSDADLAARTADESRRMAAWAREKTPRRDTYGGSLDAWRLPPTGFYAVAKRGGFWWLVTPLGHPVFYTGICSAPALHWDVTPTTGREALFQALPPRDGPTAQAWTRNAWGDPNGGDSLALNTLNMIRKYGPGWEARGNSLTRARLAAWGFSGLGKWADLLPNTPDVPVLGLPGVPKLARHLDPFDPAACAAARTALEKQILPRINDPRVVGWSLGNEYDEIVTAEEIKDILALPETVPAKAALLAEARSNLPGSDPAHFSDADREHLRRFYADRYYDFLYRTIKAIDPHHLYLGFWIVPNWWVNDEDWRLIAAHCDVVGYDYYNDRAAPEYFAKLLREAGKPAFCGEFSFPSFYDGRRGFGLFGPVHSQSDADAGRLYQSYVADAARNPACIGACWFQLRDEPVTGRGPGHGPDLVYGEHYADGLVDVGDTPKWDLVTRVRAENLAATAQRLAGHP